MDTRPYDKIETLFNRDTNFRVTTELRNPVYGSFKTWHVTEKIDGTNIRIMLDIEGNVRFGGRTDNAQLPTDLLLYLQDTFTAEKMKTAFWIDGAPTEAILYGEGYGAGIQSGGYYNEKKSFRLFDVLVAGKWWLDWANVEDVSNKLGIKTAPYLGEWTLDEIIERVKVGVPSVVAKEEAGKDVISEGIIGRTVEPLFDKRGRRVILKLKTKDFSDGEECSS
jgi:hypothetical protein